MCRCPYTHTHTLFPGAGAELCTVVPTHTHTLSLSPREPVLPTVLHEELALGSPGSSAWAGREQTGCEAPFPEPPLGAESEAGGSFALWPPARPVARRRGGKIRLGLPGRRLFLSSRACQDPLAVMMEEEKGAEEQQRFSYQQVQENAVLAGLGEDGV